MPSDLIYREDAKDFVRHAYRKGLDPVEYLDEVPAADVRPVVRGKPTYYNGNYSFPVCGYPAMRISGKMKKFCDECGADMRPREDGNDQTDAD